jgi:hypothetical protein
MMPGTALDPDERDWRLRGSLELAEPRRTLASLVERLHEPAVMAELNAAVDEDVVITHDGARLFAYAESRAAIERARAAFEAVLRRDGLAHSLELAHWSEELEEWVDPATPATARAPGAPDRGEPRTRTFVASAGRMIREEFEDSMRNWADQLGLRCEIVEHPHLLSTQVAFTVTGPTRKLAEFASGLKAEERATIRTETAVMLSPL